jgi:hypothetical protein
MPPKACEMEGWCPTITCHILILFCGDSLATAQAKSSAELIRWLLEQYNLSRANVYGHDFAPGYDQSVD